MRCRGARQSGGNGERGRKEPTVLEPQLRSGQRKREVESSLGAEPRALVGGALAKRLDGRRSKSETHVFLIAFVCFRMASALGKRSAPTVSEPSTSWTRYAHPLPRSCCAVAWARSMLARAVAATASFAGTSRASSWKPMAPAVLARVRGGVARAPRWSVGIVACGGSQQNSPPGLSRPQRLDSIRLGRFTGLW